MDKIGTLGTAGAAGKRGPTRRWTGSLKTVADWVHRVEQGCEDRTLETSLTHSVPRNQSPLNGASLSL